MPDLKRSCFIQAIILPEEHHFIRSTSEQSLKNRFRVCMGAVLVAPGCLRDAFWRSQDALRACWRLDGCFLRAEMARKQILGDIGPIFGSLGEALLGSKRVKDLVQEQGQI